MKETEGNTTPAPPISELQLKIKPERRAAKIANTKIAESTKILASNKIIATSAPPPPPKPRAKPKPKNVPLAKSPATTVIKSLPQKISIVRSPLSNKGTSLIKPKEVPGNLLATTKTVMVTKKTTATSILNPAARLIASSAGNALATTTKLASTIQGKQVTLLTKPLIGGKQVVGGLSKVPLLVFAQGTGGVPSFIPLTTSTLPPNTLISIATTKRPASTIVTQAQPKQSVVAQPHLTQVQTTQSKTVQASQSKTVPASQSKTVPASQSKTVQASQSKTVPASQSKTVPTSQSKTVQASPLKSVQASPSQTVEPKVVQSNVTQPKLVSPPTKSGGAKTSILNQTPVSKSRQSDISLIMDCEEEELSAVQRIACKKAESEYVEMLRKLTEWKKDPEVQVVTIGADDPMPPLPTIPDVIEATRLPLIDHDEMETTTECAEVETGFLEMMPVITEIQSGVTKVLSTAKETEAESVSVNPSTLIKTEIEKLLEESSSTEPSDKSNAKPKSVLENYSELAIKLAPHRHHTHTFLTNKRKELDDMFNGLMKSGHQTLEKWMLERGLFGATRYCLFHSHIQMKLMYMSCLNDDRNKSGYKWWCPSCAVMVSASQGSFFSRWKKSYDVIMRVIYHWACNDQVKDVISEFDNDVEFVCSVYKSLRAICNAQTIHWRIGGTNHSVELSDWRIGSCRDTDSVMIYCAYDRKTRLVMLGATSTLNIKQCMATLFKTYVAKNTTVVGDRIIQPYIPSTFRLSFISSSASSNAANLNASAYLRDQVDTVLADHYKKLTLANLQAILDELAWREKFAQNPRDAFSNIITHIKQAYVCSVVTTKGVNSLPITMGSGLKVVDPNQIQSEQEMDTSEVASEMTEEEEMAGEMPPVPAEESSLEVEAKEPSKADSAFTSMDVDFDDDDYVLPLAADCILEEMSDNEESIEIDTENDTIITNVNKNPLSPKKNSKPVVEEASTSVKRSKPICQEIKVNVNATTASASSSPPQKPKDAFTIPLETYYYARKSGQAVRTGLKEENVKFKCPFCKKVFEDNVRAMKHLWMHIDNVKVRNAYLSGLYRCKFCFKDFTNQLFMQTHVERVHSSASTYPVCKICCKEFSKLIILQTHMKNSHKRCEMPYHCKICHYRSSFFQELMDHFYKVHVNTNKLLCRHCLQVFTVKVSPGEQESLIKDYFKHLQKHQSVRRNKRCNLCCLSFSSAVELRQHKLSDHISYRSYTGVVSVKPTGSNPNMMVILQSKVKKVTDSLINLSQISTTSTSNVVSEGIDPLSFMCIECKTSLYRTNHFIQNMGCSMCKFVTSCSRAFADHAIKFHSVPPREKIKPFRSLGDRLHCLCNFSTVFGDQMARHLVASKCSYEWCYRESPVYEMNCSNKRLLNDSQELNVKN